MIHVQNLTKYFDRVCAVSDVSFHIEKDEIVGLLGNNGAGKTTLMRMLTTYLPASSGVARVAGFDTMTQSMEVRKRIGYLPESVPLYPEMRVSEYLDYRAKLKGVDRRLRKGRIDYCLAASRIKDVERRLLGTLSKGYRQRVGLADALLADPPILLLDEPTDGLDPGQNQETLNLLRQLGQNHTIMLSSHLLSEVEALVTRVVIMKRGRIGLEARLVELEADPIIVIEVRGPQDAVRGALATAEGVETVSVSSMGDGVSVYDVRTIGFKDLREVLAARLIKAGHGIRRLDLKRRKLQDRWNEINNLDEGSLGAAPLPAAPPQAVKSSGN